MLRQKQWWAVTTGVAVVMGWAVWAFAAHAGEVMRGQQATLETRGISLLDFQGKVAAGEVLIVDVRDRSSFADGRIAGAIHVAWSDFIDEASAPRTLADVGRQARGRLVVTYCSCPAESSSLRAAEALIAAGTPAKALIGGLPAWRAAGGRVERDYTLDHAPRESPR